MRKFIEHYGAQDTRKMTALFATAYKTTKQRIAGNLKTMKYDEKTVVPAAYSVMY